MNVTRRRFARRVVTAVAGATAAARGFTLPAASAGDQDGKEVAGLAVNSVVERVFFPEAYGAVIEPVPSVSNAAANAHAIQAAIDAAAAAGGGDVMLHHKFAIGDGLHLKKGVRLVGVGAPGYETADSDVKGSGLFWRGGSSGIMIHFGTNNQTESITGAGLENLYLEGNSQSGVTLVSIRSNTPTNPRWTTQRGTIRNCVLAQAGVGIQWGNSANEPGTEIEQSDWFLIESTEFSNFASHGVVIDAANAADVSFFSVCKFFNCAPPGQGYVEIKRGGWIQFVGCAAGGDVDGTRDFIVADTLADVFALAYCQSEGMRNMLHVLPTNNNARGVIRLDHNIINDNVQVDATRRLVGTGNKWFHGRLILNSANAAYYGVGDEFNGDHGSRVIVQAGGVFTGISFASMFVPTYRNRGEIVYQNTPTSGIGAYQTVVVRSGWSAAAWESNTAYAGNGGGHPTWMPGEKITAGDVRLPTVADAFKYTASNGGTTGATEPIWEANRLTLDNGIIWTSAPNPNPRVVLPTVDNGHAYRLLTDGTSGGSEPTWPTTAGATVNDDLAVWQESGPSALLIPQAIHPESAASGPPGSGYHERTEIAWNSVPVPGGPIGWVCTQSGTPGMWTAFGYAACEKIITADYDMQPHDLIVGTRTGEPITVTLPVLPAAAVRYTIKDTGGMAAIHAVRIQPPPGSGKTIDGQADLVLTANYGRAGLVYMDDNWFVLG